MEDIKIFENKTYFCYETDNINNLSTDKRVISVSPVRNLLIWTFIVLVEKEEV